MIRADGLFIVAVLFIGFLGVQVMRDCCAPSAGVAAPEGENGTIASLEKPQTNLPPVGSIGAGDAVPEALQPDIIPPYEQYVITQGLHGFEYGHRAVDLSAGKGASILSPIQGIVTQYGVDAYGNTILIIENERYRVTMLHGIFSVRPGEQVEQGQVIGKESNQGLTYDLNGLSCRGRDCGYHTHLNIYDKVKKKNINPLKWFNQG